MKPLVEVQNLSKLYRLGSIGATSVRDTFERIASRFRRSAAPQVEHKEQSGRIPPDRQGPEPDTFWAIKDISFSAKAGEVVGIVGRNGAGKSTLLKILSRITEPTSGRAILHGRLASLLEVGTGFHPDLTGRENVFLNGTILGMKRWEISAKFDEIVAFAEIEQFIDTPVKHYSSGMFVRLAFAVAAHLEPEILFIDEVLAVGDAGFQKKCLGKMGEVAAKDGRTVFFVSHNMGAIRALCEHAILIENGRATMDGPPAEIISRYLASTVPDEISGELDWRGRDDGPACEEIALTRLRLTDRDGIVRTTFEADQPVSVEITYRVKRRVRGVRFDVQLTTQEGEMAFIATDHLFQRDVHEPGLFQTTCVIPGGLLNRRSYSIGVQCDIPGERYLLPMHHYLAILIAGAGNQSSSFPEPWPGVVCPRIQWNVRALSADLVPA
jgi:lipopolysaccharide transport system ATP-binding protein